MLKIFITALILGNSLISFAQKNTVEKSTNGIQSNIFGLYAYREMKLTDFVALRAELGMDASIHGGSNVSTNFVFTPSIKIEPRWYYNLKDRAKERKDTEMNAANFITIQTNYQPSWMTFSNSNSLMKQNVISITPLFGIRRNVGAYLNYEVGVGYRNNFLLEKRDFTDITDGSMYFHLRIGYRFQRIY
ncbi:MAG: hypothetical protein K2Q03_07895 [Sphingobacteriaceae bacterium]|nr:hypothetical protein [Sphingobacteriaceae bacterium]